VALTGLLFGTIGALHGSTTSALRFQTSDFKTRPSVLFVALDTTRADRMGFLGSSRGLTPTLDRLARQSIVFTRAYSQAPITPVSHATLLTGLFPPTHQVTDFGDPLPPSVPYLPALLKARGYQTAAFVAALVLDPREGTAPGFDRAFDVYDAGFRIRRPGENRYQSVERRGSDVVARALKWLDAGDRSTFFLWVHLYDPHEPYDPPSEMKRRFPSAPYDGEIAEVDRLVGLLLNRVGPSALVVVAADHGEALGDHGEETHGVFLYDATLHVPLLIQLPNQRGSGARVTTRVRLADIAPTVLEAVGAPVPPAMQGQTLIPLLASGGADRPVYAETEYPRRAFGWSPLAAWRADRFLFVRAPRRELYDLVADPGALHNVADSRSRVADGLEAELDQFIRGSTGTDPKSRVDPALAKRLASLGYVAGSGSGQSIARTDPKDRISVANALHTAVSAVEDGAFQKAIPLLERVTAEEPTIQMAQLQLGVARARQRQYAQAIGPLRKAITLQPNAMLAHYELAMALYETGDLKTSAAHFEIVTSHMPKWADARFSLGSVYARIDRVSDAVTELKAALDLAPRHFRANLLLGRLYTLQGHASLALPLLKTAVDVQRSSAEAHRFLADAYEKLGRVAEAEQERQQAKLGK
jgi:choline-sulfatase